MSYTTCMAFFLHNIEAENQVNKLDYSRIKN